MTTQIIDNFLNKVQARQLELKSQKMSIPWNWNREFIYKDTSLVYEFIKNDENIICPNGGTFFYQIIKDNEQIGNEVKDYFNFPNMVEEKFNVRIRNIHLMRLNFTPPLGYQTAKYTCPHMDNTDPLGRSVIYYITDNDGDTVFFEEMYDQKINFSKKTVKYRVSPTKGKAILFDSRQYHAAGLPSNNIKMILNMIFVIDP